MPVQFVCAAGHRWAPAGPVACPVCGESDHPTRGGDTTADAPPRGVTAFPDQPLARAGCDGRATATSDSAASPVVPGAPSITGYTIYEEIGRGGMGVVYLAVNESLARVEVVKTIRAGADAATEDLRRFQGEAEAVASLRHDHIVQIFQVGAVDRGGVRVPYMSLEFLEGGSLDKRIAGTPRPAREAAEVVEKVARAVHAAHAVGVIHRDLKPSNVLLTADGIPKVTDFGIAKRLDDSSSHTRTGSILGTPSYMAPEQARGETRRVGRATDVYGLGTILYECLTGRPPFLGESAAATLRQVITFAPVSPRALNPAVPRDLETICLKCLEKEPEKRYASAGEVAEDLRRFVNHEPILARPPGWGIRFRLWCRRPERIRDAGAFMVFLGVVCTLWSLTGLFHLEFGFNPPDPGRAATQFAAHILLLYLPAIRVGLGTMSRRRVWLWAGVAYSVAALLVCLLTLFGAGFVLDVVDVGGLHRDYAVRLPVFSLLGILMVVQFLGYCVALVSYYSNRDVVG